MRTGITQTALPLPRRGEGSKAILPLTYDPWILAAVLLLVGLGLVMVYSASAVAAQEKLGDSFHYLKRQGVAACIGLLAMATAMKLGYRRMARLAWPVLLFAMLLLIAVLIPGVGSVVNGARRWIRVPGVSIQPAEIAKVCWAIYLAYSLAKKQDRILLLKG